MATKAIKIVADFETTTDRNDLRPWAICAVDIDSLTVAFMGTTLDSFFQWLSNKHTVCYFHNLKFDGEFILSWLARNGYQYSEKPRDKTFSTLITDTGVFYSITVIFEVKNKRFKKVTFYDSLKKLPFKVSVISEAFKLKDKKLEIDYTAPRPKGHQLTEEEKDYIVNDCKIVAQALSIQMEEGLTKMTNASDAMANYKEIISKQQFEYLYPTLPIDLDDSIRKAYRGGFVYLKPDHENREGLQGITLDVNSLYPSVMYDELLPYGYPYYFSGEPEENEKYPLYIVRCWIDFELKKDHIPTIQIKKNYLFKPTEYLTTSGGLPVELFLTNVDLALIKDHYHIHYLKIEEGWRFKGAKGLFKEYIDHWSKIKAENKGAKRQLAKLMLNSLYGKFATNPHSSTHIPYEAEDGVIRYTTKEDEEPRDPVYTAMGAFITAYARNKTIRSAQRVYDRFIYADTDSLHLIGYEIPEGLEVHPKKLGAWKHEGNFTKSKFIRAKTYMETMADVVEDSLYNYCVLMEEADWVLREPDGLHYEQTHITCAGMPANVKELVTYENFKQGSTFPGKLLPRRYPGGVILEDSNFTIK